ncbi:hypothetical protein Tco_0401431 [Tanacetum coccineum]
MLSKFQNQKRGPRRIIRAKKEQDEEKQDSTYSIRSTDKVDLEEFDLKSALFNHMNKNKSANRNTANYHLYHALMEALITDEDAMDKEVADKVKDHKRKHDSDDDEDDEDNEGPSAGSNQGTLMHLLQTTSSSTSTGGQINELEMLDEGNDSDMEDTDNAHIPKVLTTTWFKPIPESERPANLTEWTLPEMISRNKSIMGDLQARIESYQTKDQLERPNWDAADYYFKEDYTIVPKPRAVVYRDRNDQRKLMRLKELHKFSDGTLTRVMEKLDHMVKDFHLFEYNKGMETRKWRTVPKDRPCMLLNWSYKVGKVRSKSENKGKVPTEMELGLEFTQQGSSHEVSVSTEGVEELKGIVRIKGVKKETLHTLARKPDGYKFLFHKSPTHYPVICQNIRVKTMVFHIEDGILLEPTSDKLLVVDMAIYKNQTCVNWEETMAILRESTCSSIKLTVIDHLIKTFNSFEVIFKDGMRCYERPYKGVKASAYSDIMYFHTSAQDGDSLQVACKDLSLDDDSRKAQITIKDQV